MIRLVCIGLLGVIILFFALATGFSLYYNLFFVMAVLVVASYFWAFLSIKWFKCKIERYDLNATVGGEIKARITVYNTGFLPKTSIEVKDLSDMPNYTNGMVVNLAAKNRKTWMMKCSAVKRGIFDLGPVRVVSGDLFGLFRREKIYGQSQRIIISPRVIELPNLNLFHGSLEGEANMSQRSSRLTTDVATIRDYRSGDPLSRIHWLTTARLNRLAVKDFDIGKRSDLWFILDVDRRVDAIFEQESAVELGITSAASIGKHYLNKDISVGLIANGSERYFLDANRGRGHQDLFMECLARLKVDGSVPLAQVLPNEWDHFGNSSVVVVITSSTETEWIHTLLKLSNKQMNVVIVFIKPESFQPGSSSDDILNLLSSKAVPSFVVSKGDDLGRVLSIPRRGSKLYA